MSSRSAVGRKVVFLDEWKSRKCGAAPAHEPDRSTNIEVLREMAEHLFIAPPPDRLSALENSVAELKKNGQMQLTDKCPYLWPGYTNKTNRFAY